MIINKNDLNSIDITANILKKGQIVIIPTDTIYGFSGIVDFQNQYFQTDYKINAIKKSKEDKPLICLIEKPQDVFLYAENIPEKIINLWPNSLTVITDVKKNCPIKTQHKKIAFRCPNNKWLQNVIKKVEQPIFSTSVNMSGLKELKQIKDIIKKFQNNVDLIVNDGDIQASPSTIIEINNDNINVIRQGSIKV